MKFANIHSVVISGRFALRLAFFSFLCLLAFAMSSPRFGIAPAAGAANTTGAAQTRKHVNSKSGKAGAAQAVARETAKSEEKGAVKSAGGDAQPLTVCAQNQPISFGQTVNGTLANGDCVNPVEGDGSLVDEYTFNGTAGQQVTINLSSTAFDTVLYLLRPNGSQLAFNDDIDQSSTPPNQNSRIVITLPESGVYSILANSFAPESRGPYTLSLATTGTCSSTPIAFNQTLTGNLAPGDCTNTIDNDGTFTDLY
ncbi:MAG TPA: PPC domain-containing protein, partial [Pyrinomonadaceae bacterium]|nr:PPC domain-containing protein [Pyrinomonadaceae bacterium]